MPTDTTVNALVINKLTKAQYDEIQNPSPTELYLVPDEIDNVPTSGSDNPVKSGGIYTKLGEKQNTIDSSHKLSADLVDDSSSTNKFTNTTEKGTWNGKQAKITASGILKGDGNGGVSAALKQDIVDLGIPGTDTNTTYKLTIGNTTRGDSVNGVDLGSIKNKAAVYNGTDLSLVTTGEKYAWNNKQETLVSGTNIKTVNNESILGSGNITIQGGGSAYVPTLNSAPTSSTTTYTKDGSTVDFEIGQFCRVLNQGSYDFYQLYDLTTSNNVTTATWEKMVEESEVGSKEDVTTIVAPVNQTDATLPITTLICEVGKYYRVDVPVETLAVTLPAMTDLTTVRTVVLYLTGGTTPAVTIAAADSKDVYYQDGFEIEAGSTYEINALFNGAAWIVAAVEIVVPVEEEGGE